MLRRFPLLLRTILPFIVLVFLGGGTLVSYFVWTITGSLRHGVEEKVASVSLLVTEAASREGERLLFFTESVLAVPGAPEVISRGDAKAALPLLAPVLSGQHMLVTSVFDRSLEPLFTISPLGNAVRMADLTVLSRIRLGMGGFTLQRAGETVLLLAAAPNQTVTAGFDGGVLVGVDFRDMVRRVVKNLSVEVAAFDPNGTVSILAGDIAKTGFVPSPGQLAAVAHGDAIVTESTGPGGERFVVHLSPLRIGSDSEGSIAVAESMEGILALRRDYVSTIAILSAAGITMIILIGYFLARSINTPIRDLLAGIRRIEAGDLSVALRTEGRDEISELTASFNVMARRLRDEMFLLRRSMEDANEASQARTRFVAMVSHELKTPLSVIIGYVALMHDGTLGPPPPQFLPTLEVVRKRAEELNRLIENIIMVNRVERGQVITPRMEDTSPDRIVAEIVAELSLAARDKGVAISSEEHFAGPFRTDEDLVREILVNLVTNSIKFTPAGGTVTVGVRPAEEGDGRRSLEIRIVDTGIGIPAEHLANIWEPFFQVDSSFQRTYGGAGLGLYIVKEMVGILGGSVSVESDVGKGSRFTIRIPAPAAAAATGS